MYPTFGHASNGNETESSWERSVCISHEAPRKEPFLKDH